MLIPRATLARIERGEVTLAFRRWQRPTVRSGGTLRTSIGILDIVRVEETAPETITDEAARRAGAPSRAALLRELDRRPGVLYRIELAYREPDSRIALREDDRLSEAAFRDLERRLQRLDARSAAGAWTRRILTAVEDHPRLSAGDLAERLGAEKEWLKTHVRKLKNLGLTISHHPGYTLSPRGRSVLDWLRRTDG